MEAKKEIDARIDELKSARPFLSLFYKKYFINRLQFLVEKKKQLRETELRRNSL